MIGRRYFREGLFRCGAYQKGRVIEKGAFRKGAHSTGSFAETYMFEKKFSRRN